MVYLKGFVPRVAQQLDEREAYFHFFSRLKRRDFLGEKCFFLLERLTEEEEQGVVVRRAGEGRWVIMSRAVSAIRNKYQFPGGRVVARVW